jgi:NTE family protein
MSLGFEYGIHDPDGFSVARAIRMSMSIPLFFEPVRLTDGSGRDHIIVDGGLLSNYPLWLLDDKTPNPPWPTIGFRLNQPNTRSELTPQLNPMKNIYNFIQTLTSTMLDAHDKFYISQDRGDLARTILIDTMVPTGNGRKTISAIDFDLQKNEVNALFDNGKNAAHQFMGTWNFAN